jgi:hypothetical protein
VKTFNIIAAICLFFNLSIAQGKSYYWICEEAALPQYKLCTDETGLFLSTASGPYELMTPLNLRGVEVYANLDRSLLVQVMGLNFALVDEKGQRYGTICGPRQPGKCEDLNNE